LASPTLSESIDRAITSLQELALRLGVTLPPPPPAIPLSVPASLSLISTTLVFADVQTTPNFISPPHRHVSSSRATSSNVPAPFSSSNPTTAHTIQGDTDHSMTTSPDKNPAQPSRIPIFTTWDRSMAHIFHAPSGAPPPIIVTSVEAGHRGPLPSTAEQFRHRDVRRPYVSTYTNAYIAEQYADEITSIRASPVSSDILEYDDSSSAQAVSDSAAQDDEVDLDEYGMVVGRSPPPPRTSMRGRPAPHQDREEPASPLPTEAMVAAMNNGPLRSIWEVTGSGSRTEPFLPPLTSLYWTDYGIPSGSVEDVRQIPDHDSPTPPPQTRDPTHNPQYWPSMPNRSTPEFRFRYLRQSLLRNPRDRLADGTVSPRRIFSRPSTDTSESELEGTIPRTVPRTDYPPPIPQADMHTPPGQIMTSPLDVYWQSVEEARGHRSRAESQGSSPARTPLNVIRRVPARYLNQRPFPTSTVPSPSLSSPLPAYHSPTPSSPTVSTAGPGPEFQENLRRWVANARVDAPIHPSSYSAELLRFLRELAETNELEEEHVQWG
jgi:hypothetical protein